MSTRQKFFYAAQAQLEGFLKSKGELITLWQKTGKGHCLNAYALSPRQEIDTNGAVTRQQPPRLFFALFLNRDRKKLEPIILGQIQEYDDLRKVPLEKELQKEPQFQLSLYHDEHECYIDGETARNWQEASDRIQSLMAADFTLEKILMKAVHDHTS